MSTGRRDLRAADRLACSDLGEALDLLAEVFLQPGADVQRPAPRRWRRVRRSARRRCRAVGESLRALADAPRQRARRRVRQALPARQAADRAPVRVVLPDRLGSTTRGARPTSAELFAAAGVEPEGATRRSPLDHLGLELDLLALLLAGTGGGRRRGDATAVAELAERLLRDHLPPFTGPFCGRLEAAAPAPVLPGRWRRAAARRRRGCAPPGELAGQQFDFDNMTSATPSADRRSAGAPRRRRRAAKEDSRCVDSPQYWRHFCLSRRSPSRRSRPTPTTPEQLRAGHLEEIEARLDKVEKKAAKDRINFTGDFRFEAHSIAARSRTTSTA